MKHRLVLGAALMAIGAPASAQELKGVFFAGGSAGDGANAYAGAVVSLPGARLGRGFAVRASANAGTYTYVSGITEIDADYVGGEVAIVYQLSGDWGWTNLSAGPRVNDLTLSPDDPGNERRGTRVDLAVQADGAFAIDPSWRLDYLGSVGVNDGAYQVRAGVGRLVGAARQTRIGVEASIQGDPSYTTFSGGLFGSTQVGRNVELRLAGGVTDQEDRDVRPYGSAGLAVLF